MNGLEGIPLAVEPRYRMSRVNEPITLYEDAAILVMDDGVMIPDCCVKWEWRREPNILAEWQPQPGPIFCGLGLSRNYRKLNLTNLETSASARPFERSENGREIFNLDQQTTIGTIQPAQYVIFHLINCRRIGAQSIRTVGGGFIGNGRLHLEGKGWLIDIDEFSESSKLVQHLDKFGGQAITHVVRVQRPDSSPINLDDFNSIVAMIRLFLEFATGVRPQVCLPSGYDSIGNRLWEVWNECGPSLWLPLRNWVSDYAPVGLNTLFPGFLSRLLDSTWHDPIKIVIGWYGQVKQHKVETALTLGLSALELLACTLNEEVRRKESEEFDKKNAHWRIRWLLKSLQIDLDIPPRLTKLREFRFSEGVRLGDGPKAICTIRDAIAHPKRMNREKFGSQTEELRHEAALLVLYYLEHALLRICGFQGIASAMATHDYFVNYQGHETIANKDP